MSCNAAYVDDCGDRATCGEEGGFCPSCLAKEAAYWRSTYVPGLALPRSAEGRAEILDAYSDDPAKAEGMRRAFAQDDRRHR